MLANAYPFAEDEEFTVLAMSIRDTGLHQPVVLASNGETLIDGWRRLRACGVVEVEPRYVALAEGVDPIAYIIAANQHRRHLSQGQRTMLGVLGYFIEAGETRQRMPQGLQMAAQLAVSKSIT